MNSEALTPRLTVVVPTRHRNDLLAKCLDRLAPGVQTLPAPLYEVVVTDDGSETTAEEMIRSQYPWARWVAGPRRGPAANRNHGAGQARGEWVAFTDDDCVPTRDWLRGFLGATEQVQAGVFEGKVTCEAGVTSPLYSAPVNLEGGCLWTCNMLVKKELFESLGGFDQTFPLAGSEDVDFRERLRVANMPFVFVPDAIVDHPPRPTAVGSKAGQIGEGFVVLWYKSGRGAGASRRLIRHVLVKWVREVQRYPWSLDSLRCLTAMVAEVVYIARHGGKWERKYRQIFQDVPPAYNYPHL